MKVIKLKRSHGITYITLAGEREEFTLKILQMSISAYRKFKRLLNKDVYAQIISRDSLTPGITIYFLAYGRYIFSISTLINISKDTRGIQFFQDLFGIIFSNEKELIRMLQHYEFICDDFNQF